MTVSRLRGCRRTWARDPFLEVACPTCLAPVGVHCRRPSEHRVWGGAPHAERDIAADRGGHYGECPEGLCGLENVRRRREAADLPLLARAGLIP